MSINDELVILREVAPFSMLDNKKLKLLAFMSEIVFYRAGTMILKQGDKGDAVFILIDGLIDVSISPSSVTSHVREMGRHAFFGEIAVMRNTFRAATVTAKTDITALKVSKDVLCEMIADEPELGTLIADHIEKAGNTIP
jgi:CRP/FNR family cyclic AMP-dependent transcriptional regulator